MCVCVCVRVRVCVGLIYSMPAGYCAHMLQCVYERDRETERERVSVSVYMCVRV